MRILHIYSHYTLYTYIIDPTSQMWMQLREYMSTNPRPNFNLATQRSDTGNNSNDNINNYI